MKVIDQLHLFDIRYQLEDARKDDPFVGGRDEFCVRPEDLSISYWQDFLGTVIHSGGITIDCRADGKLFLYYSNGRDPVDPSEVRNLHPDIQTFIGAYGAQ